MVKLHSIAPYFGEVIETHDNTLDCEVVRASGRDAGEYMQEWAGYYIVEADPEEEIKKNCSLYSPSEGPGTTGNQV
ncbi:hypothetical protein BGX20_009300 [Mortierella sp. AD010]|nr:hypothetical protein BGX20_009300 [Mortierella sp. AD010]